MKKIFISLVLVVVLLIPFQIRAYDAGISNYFIDVTIQKNGDLLIKELFELEDYENGYERIINYQTNTYNNFDGSLDSFKESNIYRGKEIQIIKVQALEKAASFADLDKTGVIFNETDNASIGDYGVYTNEKTTNGNAIRIFNPYINGTNAFYIEYIIKDSAVLHNDIGELFYTVFSENDMKTEIFNLELRLHLDGNNDLLRGWLHGPLYGNVNLEGKNVINYTFKNLYAGSFFEIRAAFDKGVIADSTKKSNVNALDKIIEVEEAYAKEANDYREQIQREIDAEEKAQAMRTKIMYGFISLYLVGLIYIINRNYHKYDKEYDSSLKVEYYRDFPNNYGPEVVGYLINKQISNNDLSASILYLIYRKNIKYENKNKKDYLLILNNRDNINETEEKLMNWLFDDKNEISMSELKRKAKSNYSSFLKKYNNWLNSAKSLGQSYNFYEDNSKGKVLLALYCIIGLVSFVFAINTDVNHLLLLILICASFGSLIYIMMSTKRTIKGNEDYVKWKALKKFMLDFGNMQKKELPEIVLWEKYLVYAVTLGCATKLAKTMEIKMAQMNDVYNSNMFDPYAFNNMMLMSNVINSSVRSAITSAHAEQNRVNSSNSSSGGGFGGGASFGGGGFGGGSGGGGGGSF